VGAVKIYVALVEALRKKERWVKLRKPSIEIDGFLSFTLSFILMCFFAGFFFNHTLFMTKLKVLVLSFPDFTDNSSELASFFPNFPCLSDGWLAVSVGS
jgi:hypothetical protein